METLQIDWKGLLPPSDTCGFAKKHGTIHRSEGDVSKNDQWCEVSRGSEAGDGEVKSTRSDGKTKIPVEKAGWTPMGSVCSDSEGILR